jgi:hypothetical protein
MRSLALIGLAGVTVGCVGLDSDLVYRGTLDTETAGVVLYEDGQTGHAGMSGTTCAIDTSGAVSYDVDVDGSDENVLDGSNDDDGSVVLARGRDTLYMITGTTDWSWGPELAVTHDVAVPGVASGALTQDGVVAYGDCAVTWLDRDLTVGASVSVPTSACAADFAADPVSGTAFVATGSQLAVVAPTGATVLDERADLVTFAGETGAMVVASRGGSEVRALALDGSLLWSTALDGAVTQVADLGDRGSVAVMVETNGTGALVLLDASTGELQRDFALPSPADLTVAPNGAALGMVVDRAVHFYTLR